MLLCCLFGGFRASTTDYNSTRMSFNQPTNFPAPKYNFDNNQLTKEGFALGKKLFYDPILSNNNTIACSSCHKQASSFADSMVISPGAEQRLGTRNSPPIMNLAWSTSFFWDGNISHLDLQPIMPITSHVEMDEQMDSVIDKLKKMPSYREQFLQAFGSEAITTTRVMKALSQFMVMCVSSNSKYDKVMRKEGYAFTAEEKKGYTLVRQKCSGCHPEPLFTDYSLHNNGLEPGHFPDEGRFIVSKDVKDKMKFKVPSLRNLSFTAPYMHDGRFASLEEVLDHYASGIKNNTNADSLLITGSFRGISLSSREKHSVLVFLRTLDDKDFLDNVSLRKSQ